MPRPSEEVIVASQARRTAAPSLARRNPPEEALRCPASRRLLRTLENLGGRDCPASDMRDRVGVGVGVGVGATNLSNIARPLVTHGLVARRQNPKDARNALFSLTDLGRQALHRAAKPRPDRFQERVHVVETFASFAQYETRIVRQPPCAANGSRIEPSI